MFKKTLAFLLVVLLLASIFTGCGNGESEPAAMSAVSSDEPAASSNVFSVEVSEESAAGSVDDSVVIGEAEVIAFEVAEAVMTYDLATIQKYSVLDSADCEVILAEILTELKTEDGKYDWDGIVCDTYDDFITVYDEENGRAYEKLEITVIGTTLHDDTAVLAEADARELLYRKEDGMAAYEEIAAELAVEKVAVTEFSVVYKDESYTGADGETVTYEEETGTLTVYMVLVDGEWKSYSPTLAGTFPPLGHFPRYIATEE